MKLIFQSAVEAIDGHKTNFLVLCAIALWLGMVFGWWTWDQVKMLFELLGILGIAAFRSALKKIG